MSSSSTSTAGSRALVLVGCVVFAEPLASTLLFPFVYFMVRDFTQDQTLIGFRVGLITSSFFLCQLITTPVWGMFSDRFGRKKAFVIGLLGGAISMLFFGLSQSLLWAILSRSTCGLLNGNIGVARTTIAEIATKYDIKQSKAFSVFGFCGAFGYIAGPLIGGMLSNPGETLGLHGPNELFVHFPYLLPCLVSALFNLTTTAVVSYALEETNPSHHLDVEHSSSVVGEVTPLLPSKVLDKGSNKSSWKLPKEVIVLVVATALVSLHTIMFEESYPLFAASSHERGTGLDFNPRDIAVSLSALGPAVFVTQLFIYPALNSRVDTIKLWKISAISFAVDYPLTSLLPLIRNGYMMEIMLVCVLCIRACSVIVGWTSLNILTNRIVEPSRRGFITGIVQASASLSRAIGPTLGGALWSWSENNNLRPPLDFHLFFLVLSLLALLQGVTGFLIPRIAASKN